MRGVVPWRYQVMTLVHSPASVGAISSPMIAFRSVDLPAFTMPAIATRSGSSSRLACSSSRRSASGSSRYRSAAASSSPRASSSTRTVTPEPSRRCARARRPAASVGLSGTAVEMGVECRADRVDRTGALGERVDALEVAAQGRHPVVAFRRVHRGRLLGREHRVGERTVVLVGDRGEVVARGALHDPQAIPQLLADLEDDLVDLAADERLRLVATSQQAGLGVVLVGLAPDHRARGERERIDDGHPDDAGDDADHQHAAVRALEPDVELLHGAEPARVERRDIADGVEHVAGVVDVDDRKGRPRPR